MIVPISSIYIPPVGENGRIREDKGDINELMELIKAHGQLMPVLVVDTRHDNAQQHSYTLVDGERRLTAITKLSALSLIDPALSEQLKKKNVQIGHVEVKIQEELTPFEALLQEWAANGGRKDFDWRENAKFVKLVHEEKKKEVPNWNMEQTGALVGLSAMSVSRYLGLVEESEVFNDERVQGATTLRTAIKQAEIAKNIQARKRIAKHEESIKPKKDPNVTDYLAIAKSLCTHMDAREWIKTIPDGSLSWFHWDPPYGTREGSGGAFSAHEAVSMDAEYCFKLMQDMMPEIHRVLKDGAWFVMWYSHVFYEPIKRMLQGHVYTNNNKQDCVACCCRYCGESQTSLNQFEGHYFCPKSPHAFWTNPFANYWIKTGVGNDGHEIKRFLKKDTEPFFLACKSDNPILPFTSRGNTFPHAVPIGTGRRHVNQKPVPLLSDILQVISVRGEVGGDAGIGSGTIFEAGLGTGRPVVGCDISEANVATCIEVVKGLLEEKKITSTSFAPWIE